MKALADACRARFNVTGTLGLDEMIKLVSSPAGVTMIYPGHLILTHGDYLTSPTDNGGTSAYGWVSIAQAEYQNKDKVDKMNQAGPIKIEWHLFWQGTGTKTVQIGQDADNSKPIIKMTAGKENVYTLTFQKGQFTTYTTLFIAMLVSEGAVLDQAKSYVQAVPM